MLYYCPFEGRPDRYSLQLSAPDTGWNESAWKQRGIVYHRVEGWQQAGMEREGTIFDLPRRSRWCLQQTINLLKLWEKGAIGKDDIIYFDDALHPGIEALALAIPKDKRPKMFAWLHGTYFDSYDFLRTTQQHWAAMFERMLPRILDGIFVACPALKNHWEYNLSLKWHENVGKVYATGHVWDTSSVRALMPHTSRPRQNKVVYASRWDSCKDPGFFLNVAKQVKRVDPDAEFVVCSSADTVKSDNIVLEYALTVARNTGLVTLKTGLTKREYYEELATAKVVFSSSKMDWISYVLLEGSAAGAHPIVPDNWCFREALRGNAEFLYKEGNVFHARDKVLLLLDRDDLWTEKATGDRAWIHERFDSTWDRRLAAMGLIEGSTELEEWK